MLVEVYRNLNRKGLWFSLRDRKTGLVTDRIDLKIGDRRCLRHCTFNVSKAGRERVLREQRKNVHALIRGEVMPYPVSPPLDQRHAHLIGWRVTYDPYKQGHFVGVHSSGVKIKLKEALFVTFDSDGVTAWTEKE